MPSFVGRFEWTAPYRQSLQVCSICWPSLQLFQNQPCHALPASTLCVLGWPGLSLIRWYTRLQPATLLCVILLRYKGRVSAQTGGGTVTWDPLRPARPPPDSSLNYATRYFRQVFYTLAAPQASSGFRAAGKSKAHQIVGQTKWIMTFAPEWKVAQSHSPHSVVEQQRREVHHGPCREPRYGIPPLPLLPHSFFLLFLFLFLFHPLNPLPPSPWSNDHFPKGDPKVPRGHPQALIVFDLL